MDAVTRPLDQKEYSSEKIDLRVWRRLIAYAMRRKGDVVRLACVLLVVSSIDILYPQLTASPNLRPCIHLCHQPFY